MTDREEREEHIKRLEAALACEEKQFSGKCSKQTCDDNCALLYEQGNWGEWKETLRYAINSLKIDLKYDLLYEETSGQADKPTTKNYLGVDAISRSDVLKLMQDNWHTHNGDWAMQESMDDIRALPAVTPQEPRWIPVSEKLPEDSGEYLVSVIDEYNEDQSYYKAVEVAWFAHKKDYDIKESEWRELGIDEKVIAWMSLPQAYEPHGSEG